MSFTDRAFSIVFRQGPFMSLSCNGHQSCGWHNPYLFTCQSTLRISTSVESYTGWPLTTQANIIYLLLCLRGNSSNCMFVPSNFLFALGFYQLSGNHSRCLTLEGCGRPACLLSHSCSWLFPILCFYSQQCLFLSPSSTCAFILHSPSS